MAMASTVPHAPSERLSTGGPDEYAVPGSLGFKINCIRSMFAPICQWPGRDALMHLCGRARTAPEQADATFAMRRSA
jgi:hypothetical protein